MKSFIRKLPVITLALTLSIPFTSYAGWEQTGTQWKYKDSSTSAYLTNGWHWLDGNNDGIAECYYLDSKGIMIADTIIEGYTVNSNGTWTVNGIVQTKTIYNPPQETKVQVNVDTSGGEMAEGAPSLEEEQKMWEDAGLGGIGKVSIINPKDISFGGDGSEFNWE